MTSSRKEALLQTYEPIPFLGNFIDGEFHSQNLGDESWQNVSPANHSETVSQCQTAYSHVGQSIEAASKAFRTWSLLPVSERIEALILVREAFEKNRESLEHAIARETGKPLWECKTEVNAMIGKFAVTIDHSLKLVSEEKIQEITPGVDGFIRYQPRGVLAVLGPFNFPGHLPNGHIIPALLTGNTVVFKPSELTPMTAQVMAQCFAQAKIPAGVFNMVHGGGEVGRRMVSHKGIEGVLFTGSYETGLKIQQATLNDYWKINALEMGGKNATVVWKDADLQKSVYDTLVGSFLTAGQRCSGTSRVFVHSEIYQSFLDLFYEKAKNIEIGHWETQPFMGSLISAKSVDSYLRYQEIALREGAEKVMRGKVIEPGCTGNYVTPSIYAVPGYDEKSVYQNSEIFGPNVAIYSMDDLAEPIEANNKTGFGLSMAVFSKDRAVFDEVLAKAKVGLLNWNRTTNGASSRLPFGGCGKSGNGRPAAHFSVFYSTNVVASLEDRNPFDPSKTMPGVKW